MTYRDGLREFKLLYWRALMHKHGENITQMAREAGVSRGQVYKHLRPLGIQIRRLSPQSHRGRWDD